MNNNDLFEKAPISKAYFKLALPVVLSMVISLVYNMVDTFFVAQTQKYKSCCWCFFMCAYFYFNDSFRRYLLVLEVALLFLVYLGKKKMKKERTSVVFVSMELLFVVS